jgi:hypothetical protein
MAGAMRTYNGLIFAGANGSLFAAVHVVDAEDVVAGKAAFGIGATRIFGQAVQIVRAGAMVTDDVMIDNSNAVLTISNGVAYELTVGDVINVVALGA